MSIDLNGDGIIDYHEFIAATLSATKVSEENIKQLFNLLDRDGNGTITA